MSKRLRKTKTVLVPIGMGTAGQSALAIAQAIAEEVILVGVVPIGAGESVSAGAQGARAVRKRLLKLSNATTRFKSTVIVSEAPWKDIQNVITFEKPDLLIVEWDDGLISCCVSVEDILTNSLCDVAILHGTTPQKLEKILIAVRGGPYAELSLQAGMNLHPSQLDVLHLALTGSENDTPFRGMRHILRQIPEVNLHSITADDPAQAILEESKHYDMVILGATGSKSMGGPSLGPVAEKMLRELQSAVMVIKTRRPITEGMLDERSGELAISILVDKWFAENTFHANEFADLKQLMELKEKQGTTISLALPALNEEKTVGKILTMIKKALMDDVPLLDEMMLIDFRLERSHTRDRRGTGYPCPHTSKNPAGDGGSGGERGSALEEPAGDKRRHHCVDRYRHHKHPPPVCVRDHRTAPFKSQPSTGKRLLPPPAQSGK